MKPFDYSRASSVAEALRGGSEPESKFLGGGTNLVDLMRYGVETPTRIIDINHLALGKIEDLGRGGLRVGALVRNSDLAADHRVLDRFPVLSQALLNGASPQIRNMASAAGNLLQRTRCSYFYDTAFPCNKRVPGAGCSAIAGVNRMHAILGASEQCIAVHPSDMAVAMALLDASVNVQGPKGKRAIPIAEFHRLPGEDPSKDTNLAPGELITSIDIPALTLARRSTYVKVRDRNSFAFALVSVAAALEIGDGVIKSARMALGGVAHKPWRSAEAEEALVGKPPHQDTYRAAAEIALSGAKGYGHNDFKVEMAKLTVVRAFSILGGSA